MTSCVSPVLDHYTRQNRRWIDSGPSTSLSRLQTSDVCLLLNETTRAIPTELYSREI